MNLASTLAQSRYSRQILFESIGTRGQASISASRVVLVGCGALGTVQASLLVRAGVGTLRIIDRDLVDESNLQRQILFDEDDVRRASPKAVAAAKKLRLANSLVNVEGVAEDVNPSSIERLLGGFDLILDGTDNFEARYLINDYSVKNNIPWIYGACVAAQGLMFPILPGETACLQCVFESRPPAGDSPSCDTAGVIGPIVVLIAGMQVAEALKVMSGALDRVCRKIISIDLWENHHKAIGPPARNPDCPCCARRAFAYLDGAFAADAITLCGRNSVQISRQVGYRIDLRTLANKLRPLGKLQQNQFLLRASMDEYQLTVFHDGRAIINGTNDIGVAKSIYARYVGN